MIRRCPEHGFFRGEVCPCGEPGQVLLDDERTEKLGRLVAGALRHFPDDLGLAIDSRGWVDLDSLTKAIRTRYRWADKDLLIALVQSDPKKRYEIEERCIRARYGHSVDVDLDYPTNTVPALYYGASEEEAGRILEVGLKSASQRYVHLSTTLEKAWFVGTFRTKIPIIIEVDARAAQNDGITMMTVSEAIVISENIPPIYLNLVPAEG
ncbi:MAG: RNA 2'-phosphotransferase [Euryarchaeota archaeon]|nr:RNA 2'-phosphotransferase [Euryarchaeota archaeon]